jgi:hypothetical protein
MKIVIPQKMSGTGSIHDVNSDQFDIEIALRNGCKFAVGVAAYYNVDWTTHKTMETARRRASALSALGYTPYILSAEDGRTYDRHGYTGAWIKTFDLRSDA